MNATPAVATQHDESNSNEEQIAIHTDTQSRTHWTHEDQAHTAGADMMQPLENAGTAGSSLQTAPEEVEIARPNADRRVKFRVNNIATIKKYILPWRTANKIHRLRVPDAQTWYQFPWQKCS